MKTKRSLLPLALALWSSFGVQPLATFAQGTAFSYQGRLNDGANPAGGLYDLRFAVCDALAGGNVIAGPRTNAATGVTNGLFTVTLDFGSGVFTGPGRWLEIAMRTNGSTAFTPLSPRQPLTSAPYAITATSASNLLGTVSAAQLSGVVGNAQLANSSVTVTAGTGLTGGGTVPLGGAIMLNNAGVVSITGNADITASTLNGAVTLDDTATSANTANTMVKRDVNGSFSAGSLLLSSNLYLPTTAAGAGIIYSGSSPFIYSGGSGAANFFAGFGAGNLTISGNFNTAVGYATLDADTTGANNSAFGYGALGANTTGNENLASGVNALAKNINGGQNTAYGPAALYRNTNGTGNTASGYETLFLNTSGSNNTASGYKALLNNTSGNANLALGYLAGSSLTTGSSNIDIGHPGLATDTNIIRIGSSQSQTYIAGLLNGDAGGLTNLNPANLTGLVPGSIIDDGGSAAFAEFLGPAKALSSADPLPFASLSLVSSNGGAAPALTFSLDGTGLGTVAGFVGHEAISEPYEFVVEVIAPNSTLVPDAQLGRSGAVTLARNGRSTTFAGVVTGCSVSSYDGTSSLFTFRLEPLLAYLALTSDYRVNQNISVPDLVASLYNTVTANTLTRSLSGTHPVRELVVQYGETDLNFFSRLLEDEGIFYFFGLGGTPPPLILGDDPGSYLSAANSPFSYYGDAATNVPSSSEYIRTFQKANRESVKTATLRTYNFKTPGAVLQGTASDTEGRGEQYRFGSSANTGPDLTVQAQLRVQRQVVEHHTLFGSGNAPDLRPGCTFTLNDQSGAGLAGSYLVTAVRHGAFRRLTNGVASLYYGNEFEVISSTLPYRPALKTPKPTALPCTAVVTGPAGEEIYTDQYGRVKVQFHWDRYGAKNENSSAWIRAASPWAGSGRGLLFLPRIGDEVMVGFVQGDPDQPLITGSLYNGQAMSPYALPDNKTRSTIKTMSSKGGGGANEIMFEDKKGAELLAITAAKDYTNSAINNLAISAGNDMMTAASHDLVISAGHNLTLAAAQGVGLNTANNPAYALNVGGTVKAAAFQGDGSGLTGLAGLPPNVAFINSNQTFSAQSTFSGPVSVNSVVQFYAGGFLNDQDLYLRNDLNHGVGWYGIGKPFAGVQVNGPVLYGFSGGALGFKNFTSTNLVLTWTSAGNVGIGTNAPTATLDVVGDERLRGLIRSGSETGTAEVPSPAGLVMRRVNSVSSTSNAVVAVARITGGTANMALVRDGTAGGFQIQYPASPGNVTIACMGIDSTGTARNYYTTLANPGTAGTLQIYSNAVGVVHFECTFGITYSASQHLTQVTLSRYGTDYFWSGTLTSTYNQ